MYLGLPAIQGEEIQLAWQWRACTVLFWHVNVKMLYPYVVILQFPGQTVHWYGTWPERRWQQMGVAFGGLCVGSVLCTCVTGHRNMRICFNISDTYHNSRTGGQTSYCSHAEKVNLIISSQVPILHCSAQAGFHTLCVPKGFYSSLT
jgi:hypothetical protein